MAASRHANGHVLMTANLRRYPPTNLPQTAMFTILSPPQPTYHNDYQGARHHPAAQKDVDDMDYEIDVDDLDEGSSAVTSPGQVITSSQAFMR